MADPYPDVLASKGIFRRLRAWLRLPLAYPLQDKNDEGDNDGEKKTA